MGDSSSNEITAMEALTDEQIKASKNNGFARNAKYVFLSSCFFSVFSFIALRDNRKCDYSGGLPPTCTDTLLSPGTITFYVSLWPLFFLFSLIAMIVYIKARNALEV